MKTAKHFVFSLFLVFCFIGLPSYAHSQKSINVEYSFEQVSPSTSDLQITFEFKGDPSGTSRLLLPNEWGGQKELYKKIYDLECSAYSIQNTEYPYIKKIRHKPNDLIKIKYKVQLYTEQISRENYHRPLGAPSYFFGVGYGLFIIPQNNTRQGNVTLNWNKLPAHWSIANSFGSNQRQQKLSTQLSNLQSGVFLGGDFNLLQCGTASNPICIAMKGTWPFSNQEFISLVEKIINSQRDFWNDHNFPNYLISVMPMDDENAMVGTALTNAFALFLGKLKNTQDNYIQLLTSLISHEHFHTWNGCKMHSTEPSGSMYWFSEGFTEYYSAKLNYHYGIIDIEKYIEHINMMLADYFSSPVHNERNDRIVKDFWNNSDVQRLPYARGFTLALYLDLKIQSNSSGLHSLDNLMYDLQKTTEAKNGLFSKSDLLSLFTKYLTSDDIVQLDRYIIHGDSVPLHPTLLQNQYHVEWTDLVGFDLQRSLAAHVIQGLKPNSTPAKAGVKNGMKLVKWSKKGTKVQLTISEKKGLLKTISYEISAKQVPQYVPR